MMVSHQLCRVIGVNDDGERIVITDYIPRDKAEEFVVFIARYSVFARLTIDGDEEAERKVKTD